MSTLNAICVGIFIGGLGATALLTITFDPIIYRAQHAIVECPTGCRTRADITCENFRRLLTPPSPRGFYPVPQ